LSERPRPPEAAGPGARRLSLVLPEHELPGHAPALFERLAKRARPGSTEHRGLLAVAQALAREAAWSCLPPSARKELQPAFSLVESIVAGRTTFESAAPLARGARASTFAALPTLEQLTRAAVSQAAEVQAAGPRTSLTEHAGHTLGRWLGLSVHHAVAAVCRTLESIESAEHALTVPSDASGALAYGRTALGSARSPAFQAAAIEQARFEHERAGSAEPALRAALEIQIFHEYLGARWRAHADQARLIQAEFIAWALQPLER